MTKLLKFLFDCVLVVGLAVLQSAPVASVYGIKPNLVMIFLLVESIFMGNFPKYAALSVLGTVFLRFTSGLERESVVLFFLLIAAFIFKKYFIKKTLLSAVCLAGFSTLIFYLIADINFIIESPLLFVQETVYNVFIGIIFYYIIKTAYEKTEYIQRGFLSRGSDF
ncbi:MAG: hypothetical protein PHP03_02645 [Candidatus Pacebacteria bacterium]|nr:hypothetical protein [Candidatus Paceibacterota bacterium]